VLHRLAREIPQLGILTTKSIGLYERKGNNEPILARSPEGGILNCVGLSNPGEEASREELASIYPLPEGAFLMVSVFGATAEELVKVAQGLERVCDGIELNFSCPHAEAGLGASIGSSPELSARLTRAVKDSVSVPVSVKLPPIDSIGDVAGACAMAGADAIVAVNTWGPLPDARLSLGRGGLSDLH